MINEKWAGWVSNEFYVPQNLGLFKSLKFHPHATRSGWLPTVGRSDFGSFFLILKKLGWKSEYR